MNEVAERCCIYCFRKDELSNSHLFSECIGGAISEAYSCKHCNAVLGRMVEGRIKESPFFAKALEQLGLQSKGDAYRNIRDYEDEETGRKLYRRKDGSLVPKPRSGIASKPATGIPVDVSEFLRWVEQHRPYWLEHAKIEVAQHRERINIAGDVFKLRDRSGPRKVKIISRTLFPFELLAKIAFEAMAGFGFGTAELIQDFYRQTFHVYQKDHNTSRIDIDRSFHKRVASYNAASYNGKADLSTVDYRPFHRLDFRLAEKGIAYLKVNFFGAASFTVSLGSLSYEDYKHELLGKRVIFPIGERGFHVEVLPSRNADVRTTEDAAAAYWWWKYNEEMKKRGEHK